jgi:hypothetical protein
LRGQHLVGDFWTLSCINWLRQEPYVRAYVVDPHGIIVDQHFGEGRHEQSERVIQQLLGIQRELVSVQGVGVEAEADWTTCGRPRPISATGQSTNKHRWDSGGLAGFGTRPELRQQHSGRTVWT